MSQTSGPILSTLILIPLLGAILLACVEGAREALIKRLALAISGLDFLVSLIVFARHDPAVAGMQFVERAPWINSIGSSYFLGVDGISLPLLLLTTFLTPVAILASFSGIAGRVKGFMICVLLLEGGMIGVFVALDLVLFYVFWEGMLIPMYFLIGVWGGAEADLRHPEVRVVYHGGECPDAAGDDRPGLPASQRHGSADL